jgi:metal-sulfur cluster biosynthetic enzyme
MTERDIRDALREVVDPELGVNIVDLGLVYGVAIDGGRARITMTTTSAVCPLGDFLKDAAEASVRRRFSDLRDVEVTLVREPPWSPERLSAEARRQLGGGRES